MKITKKLVDILSPFSVRGVTDYIIKFIDKKDSILDLGSGTGTFTNILRKKGHKVVPVDIRERSKYKDVITTIYNGRQLPFKNNEFDTCIIIAVLHHTPNPEIVLKEAIRVSRKIIIYEDAITNVFQKYYTFLVDSYFNKELIAPHSNKTDEEWRKLFKKLKLKLVKTEYMRTWLFLFNPIYFLEK